MNYTTYKQRAALRELVNNKEEAPEKENLEKEGVQPKKKVKAQPKKSIVKKAKEFLTPKKTVQAKKKAPAKKTAKRK